MKQMKICVILLALLLAAMVMVPMVSAAGEMKGDVSSPDVELIKSLIGKNVSVGEYYEKVSPDTMKDMPLDLRKQLFQTKMEWPAPISEADYKSVNTNSKSGFVATYSGIYGALSESGLNPVYGNLLIYGSNTYTDPSGTVFPYLSDMSTLMKWNAGINQWDPVDSKSHSGFFLSTNSASGNYYATPGIYTSFGTHAGTFPLGCYPMQYVMFTQGPLLDVY
ncbi:MAG: hypothetical protein Q7T80_08000 [Methanoregula sp.]|nr:hypothetical protein [Methanoregula sp.]